MVMEDVKENVMLWGQGDLLLIKEATASTNNKDKSEVPSSRRA